MRCVVLVFQSCLTLHTAAEPAVRAAVSFNPIILPGDARRTTSKLLFRRPATHFWCQIRSLETQNGLYFSLFQSDRVWELEIPFRPFPIALRTS